jgi:hypothetical protein
MKIREGQNIKVTEEGEDVFISAPVINKTVVKHGPFILLGECIEIFEGEHIRFQTAAPNKLTVSANIDKEKLRIVDLETRVKNLEKVIVVLMKEGKDGEEVQEVIQEEVNEH